MEHKIYCVFVLVYLIETVICDVTQDCTLLLDEFSKCTSEFVQCAINNSRPIKLCENCIESYMGVLESYHIMTNTSDVNGPCINNFINLDRLQIVLTVYHNNVDLWTRAKCFECFNVTDQLSSPSKSNKTIIFDELHQEFMKCLNTSNNSTNICSSCMDKYLILNDYYNSISNENEKIGVCMDIVDVMNTTRKFWSDKCCKSRQHPEYVFLGSTVFVTLSTALFYVLVKLFNDKKRPTILQQSRFAGSLSQFNSTAE